MLTGSNESQASALRQFAGVHLLCPGGANYSHPLGHQQLGQGTLGSQTLGTPKMAGFSFRVPLKSTKTDSQKRHLLYMRHAEMLLSEKASSLEQIGFDPAMKGC